MAECVESEQLTGRPNEENKHEKNKHEKNKHEKNKHEKILLWPFGSRHIIDPAISDCVG
jgi:hypothetical protein